jgi:DNA polymerase V
LLKRIYKPGIYYQKAGVMVMDLVPKAGQQGDLFSYNADFKRSTNLMTTMDQINRKYSKGTIKLAAEGIERTWRMRRGFKSPTYTGEWSDLPRVA